MTSLNQSSGQRIDYIDLLKGFAMFFVVLAHSGVRLPIFLSDPLEYTRMPLYFFIAGMFVSYKKPMSHVVMRKVNRLLIPFFLFNLLYFILQLPHIHGYLLPSHSVHDMATLEFWQKIYNNFTRPCNAPMWFLMCMFFATVIFHTIVKVFHTRIWLLMGVAVIMGLVGIFLTSYTNMNIPDDRILSLPARLSRLADRTRIVTAMVMMPVMFAGYMFRRHGLHNGRRSPKMSVFIVATASAIYCLSHFVELPNLFLNDWHAIHYIFSLCTITIVITIAQWVNYWTPLNIIGQNSLVVLGLHMCVIATISSIVPRLWGTTIPLLAVTLLICLFCIKPIKRWCPALSGKTDLITLKTA